MNARVALSVTLSLLALLPLLSAQDNEYARTSYGPSDRYVVVANSRRGNSRSERNGSSGQPIHKWGNNGESSDALVFTRYDDYGRIESSDPNAAATTNRPPAYLNSNTSNVLSTNHTSEDTGGTSNVYTWLEYKPSETDAAAAHNSSGYLNSGGNNGLSGPPRYKRKDNDKQWNDHVREESSGYAWVEYGSQDTSTHNSKWDESGFSRPPGHKWQGNRGPPDGHRPPGLAGGSPPGLSNRPSGWVQEVYTERPLEGGALPERNEESTHNSRPEDNGGGPVGPDGRKPDSDGQPQNRECRIDEFRCKNGECLPRNVRCDEKFDCRDSSDEDSCTIVNRNEESGCVLLEQPEGGHYELGGCDERCNKRPGDTVPQHSILIYSCRDNYVLSGNTISVCVNDEWYKPPSCLKICPELNSTSVDISCSYQGKTVSCSERILPETRAKLSCKSSYKLPLTNDPAYREITCLHDGLWDRRVFRCLPECGTSVAHGSTLIVYGFEAELGIFPWHVGIYNKKNKNEYEQVCGGTLINSNLVVSAAHCFYDEVFSQAYDASHYAVAAGKHYRDWNADERYGQKSLVESIRMGDRYIGVRGNFAQDIALLKLTTPFELTVLVRPICLDWDNRYEREQLQVGQSGKVVGWGKDIKGESSESLQEIDMPYVPYQQCFSAVPVDFRGYLTSDKFCAGHLNGSSVSEGDSGGGLCFEKNGIWYLRGIVSVSPVNRRTNSSYVAFTYISHFREWIRDAYVNA